MDGELVEGRSGFNVYVQAVAEQQAVLQLLQDNLRQQAQISLDLIALETATLALEYGQDRQENKGGEQDSGGHGRFRDRLEICRKSASCFECQNFIKRRSPAQVKSDKKVGF